MVFLAFGQRHVGGFQAKGLSGTGCSFVAPVWWEASVFEFACAVYSCRIAAIAARLCSPSLRSPSLLLVLFLGAVFAPFVLLRALVCTKIAVAIVAVTAVHCYRRNYSLPGCP